MYILTCISREKHIQKTTPTVLYYSILFLIIHSFSKKVYSENLMLKIICGMVTQTTADSERFSIDFSFYKQRGVNFVGFFDSLCLSFIAEQRKNKKEQ